MKRPSLHPHPPPTPLLTPPPTATPPPWHARPLSPVPKPEKASKCPGLFACCQEFAEREVESRLAQLGQLHLLRLTHSGRRVSVCGWGGGEGGSFPQFNWRVTSSEDRRLGGGLYSGLPPPPASSMQFESSDT